MGPGNKCRDDSLVCGRGECAVPQERGRRRCGGRHVPSLAVAASSSTSRGKIGRAAGSAVPGPRRLSSVVKLEIATSRERGCQQVEKPVVAVAMKIKQNGQ